MTGADRTWAARYTVGDVLRYQRGSKELGIDEKSYARVTATDPQSNLITVRKSDGEHVTYNPARLHGISAYREIERDFSTGDRLSFTAPNRELGIANRDLGKVEQIANDGQLTVRMDNEKIVTFDPNNMRHFDHGYAVTSHNSQGLTADRVMVNIDTAVHPELINSRFAYVSISRAAQDAEIYTNSASSLAPKLSQSITKSSALEIGFRPTSQTKLRSSSKD
jgi:ATP-dependent exoDNAse (exonuclease V) alpha subunit